MTIKFRDYDPPQISTKPAIFGWVPSSRKVQLIMEGRGDELPGYRLYKMQTDMRLPRIIRGLAGAIFGILYAGKKV